MKIKFLAPLIFFVSSAVYAADCSDYTFGRGIDYQLVDNSEIPKILSTAVAVPFSVDAEDVNDAYIEAEIQAKAQIVKLMEELISSDTKIDEEARKISQIQDDYRTTKVERNKVVLSKISSSANAVLRGVIHLGDCHTPGREVRVTVGIKPETLAVATGLASGIGTSLSDVNTPKNSNQNSTGVTNNASDMSDNNSSNSNLREVGGSSNTEKLNDF